MRRKLLANSAAKRDREKREEAKANKNAKERREKKPIELNLDPGNVNVNVVTATGAMKLYVGGLGEDGVISAEDLRPLFEKYGVVTECECVKSYAFVHMDDESAVNAAIGELHGSQVKGRTIKVERSENKTPRRPSQKLFVGNIKEGTTSQQLREIFEQMCPVLEADVIKNFGFVHVDADQGRGKIDEIVRELNGYRNISLCLPCYFSPY